MAVAFDAVSYKVETTAVSSTTVAHTTSGSNRTLLVRTLAVDGLGVDNGVTVTGVTYNGVAMTSIATETDGAGAQFKLWCLIAPATGSNNIVVTFNATLVPADGDSVIIWNASATGTNQTNPVNVISATDANVTSPVTSSITTTVANTLVFDFSWDINVNVAPTVGAGQTQRLNVDIGGIWLLISTEPAANPSTVTMTWTDTNIVAWYSKSLALLPVSLVKTINGNTYDNTKTVDNLAIASVKTINGLA